MALATASSGCTVVELAPDRPALRGPRVDPAEVSELVVVIEGGSLGYKAGWAIYVDGVARAWLPTSASFTRIPVKPGQHEVTIAFRTRTLDIVLIPLPPMSGEVKAKRTVACEAQSRCALKAGIYIDWQRSFLIVDAVVLEDGQVDAEMVGARFVEPDR